MNVVDLTSKQRQVFSDQTESVRAAYRDEVGADVFDAWVSAVKDSTPQ